MLAIFAGCCWFSGNRAVANRRFQLLSENDSKPGTVTISGFGSNAFYEGEYQSANTILKIRGGGSGHRSGYAGGSSISAGAEKTSVAGSSSGSFHQTAKEISSANSGPRYRAPGRGTQDSRATSVAAASQNPNPTPQTAEASQNPIQRITSESVGPESILLSEGQEQSDLQAKQSSSGDSNLDLNEETQSNSGDSNSSSFFPTQGLQKESVVFRSLDTMNRS